MHPQLCRTATVRRWAFSLEKEEEAESCHEGEMARWEEVATCGPQMMEHLGMVAGGMYEMPFAGGEAAANVAMAGDGAEAAGEVKSQRIRPGLNVADD